MALPSRLSGSLPVSIAVHLAALILLFVIPLTAEVALPVPPSSIDDFIRAMPAPPPPPAPRVRVAPAVTDVPRVPTAAPDKIVPELPHEIVDARPEVEGGIPVEGAGSVDSLFSGSGDLLPAPPPPPAPKGPVRVGELLRAPVKIADAQPEYPAIARASHVEGTVILEAVIDRTGHVTRVRVLRSVPLLDRAALDAVRKWEYTPSTLHGVPVEVLMTITVTFTLQR